MDGSGGPGGLGLDVPGLQAAYAAGRTTPAAVMEGVLARIAAGDDAVWISRFPDEVLLTQARALADPAAALHGVPFAVKDNIDVAGLPTTAGCRAYAYTPDRHAPVVQRLVDAGAIPVGKTNLDQFATGLVGVRSPFGVPRNPFDPRMAPGGSSSGSAVAVAAGLVSFALGTDTAGSGRVPAGFNNLVGLKPTRGWLSTTGVVPACRSLDCVSVFALTVPDALAVAEVAGGFDPADPYSRPRVTAPLAGFRFGVPRQPEFFGDRDAEAAYGAAIRRAEALGGTAVPFDYAPFAEAAALLYGPWAAERTAAVGHMLAHGDAVHPVTRMILEGGQAVTGAALFQAQHRLAALRRQVAPLWQTLDVLLLPTTGTAYSLDEIAAEPLRRNSELGHYTNFTNLLDLAAIAVPSGFYPDGFPLGVTLIGPAWSDVALAGIARGMHEAAGLPLGRQDNGRAGRRSRCSAPTWRASRSIRHWWRWADGWSARAARRRSTGCWRCPVPCGGRRWCAAAAARWRGRCGRCPTPRLPLSWAASRRRWAWARCGCRTARRWASLPRAMRSARTSPRMAAGALG